MILALGKFSCHWIESRDQSSLNARLCAELYYFSLANDLGVDAIADFMQPFGFGQVTGIDIEGELRGVLPSTDWKRKAYKRPEQQKWYAGETISLGIGQGYNSFTVTQLANALATLSTGGERHTPHLVRDIIDVVSGTRRPITPPPLAPLPLKPEYVEVIRNSMVGVNNPPGSGAKAFANAGYTSGGKTGTAQVVGIKANEKYSAARLPEQLRDNALFIAFAPADHPTIAVAMVLENAGWGAESAAPIARRVLDYWIKGIYPTDNDIAAVRDGNAGGPPIEPGVPVAEAKNIRLELNKSSAGDTIGTPLLGADNFAGAASAVAAYAAAANPSASIAVVHRPEVANASVGTDPVIHPVDKPVGGASHAVLMAASGVAGPTSVSPAARLRAEKWAHERRLPR